MHLKIRHLEVFSALMQAGSVSSAAQRLNVTQPAVSVALSNLERELGFRLFERSKGFFAPTREAQLLYAEAEQGLSAFSRIERRATEIREGRVGSITIASNGAPAINLMPWLIADFQREYPGIHIDLRVLISRLTASLVSSRQVDIGLIETPVPVAGLEVELFRLPCVCIMREDDPLAAEAVVTPRLLDGRAVIAITGDHLVDRRLDSALAEAGVTVQRRVSCFYFAIARNLVRNGSGVALVDFVNGRTDLRDGIVSRPFEPRIDFELAMIVPQGHPRDGVAEKFRLRLRESFLAGGELASQAP